MESDGIGELFDRARKKIGTDRLDEIIDGSVPFDSLTYEEEQSLGDDLWGELKDLLDWAEFNALRSRSDRHPETGKPLDDL